jgi:hypothetical protein
MLRLEERAPYDADHPVLHQLSRASVEPDPDMVPKYSRPTTRTSRTRFAQAHVITVSVHWCAIVSGLFEISFENNVKFTS